MTEDELRKALAPASWYRVTPTGIEFLREPTIEEWLSLGEILNFVDRSLWWSWGDYLNKGEARFGETYTQALDESGYKMPTLANAKSVARKIPRMRVDPATGELIPLRREANVVSPSVHALLAKFSDGPEDHEGHARIEAWLEFSETYGLSEKKMRRLLMALPLPTVDPRTAAEREALEAVGLLRPALEASRKPVEGRTGVLASETQPPASAPQAGPAAGPGEADSASSWLALQAVPEERLVESMGQVASLAEQVLDEHDRAEVARQAAVGIVDRVLCRRVMWAQAWVRERRRRRDAETLADLLSEALAAERAFASNNSGMNAKWRKEAFEALPKDWRR